MDNNTDGAQCEETVSAETHNAQMAEGLYDRFRDISISLERYDAFVWTTPDSSEGGGRPGEREMSWTETLLEDEDEREQAAREFTLRTLRRGSDPINHWILREAERHHSLPMRELEGELGIANSSISERVNDLVQVGLLERNVERNAVQPTVLTRGFLGIVDDVSDRFASRLGDGFERPAGSDVEGE